MNSDVMCSDTTEDCANVTVGDIVLLKDKQVDRISWPMGRVTTVFPSADGKVRKVEVQVGYCGNKSVTTYVRPVTETVVLLPNRDK